MEFEININSFLNSIINNSNQANGKDLNFTSNVSYPIGTEHFGEWLHLHMS